MLEVRYQKPALKRLLKLPEAVRQRLREKLFRIATDPAGYRGDWRPLKGSPFWRLRVGEWRAICEVRSGELVLLVLKIGPRGDVYK